MSAQRGRRGGIEALVDAIALLVKQPRTAAELNHAMNLHRSSTVAYRYVKALRGEGLLYVTDWRSIGGPLGPVYAWQPSVCANPDVPRPRVQP